MSNVSLLDGRRVDLAVDRDRITGVGDVGSVGGDVIFDGRGGLCVRPLADAHLHLDKAGTARLVENPPSSISDAIAAMADIKRRAVGDAERLVDRMVETLKHLRSKGTRVLRAVLDVDETWGLTSFRAAQAARETVAGEIDVRTIVFPQEGLTPAVADLLYEAADLGADCIGAHTDIDSDVKHHLSVAAGVAREKGLPLEVHVDESASPDSFHLPLVLDLAGDLNDLVLVHCLSLATLDASEQETWCRRIQQANAAVVVAPSILGFELPLAPVNRLLDAGVRLLIGSDNLQDVFMPLGTGSVLDAARIVALVGRATSASSLRDLLLAATNGGYESVTGSRGDFVVDTAASLIVLPTSDVHQVFWGEETPTLTMINGRVEGMGVA